jgi:hypothetical protein
MTTTATPPVESGRRPIRRGAVVLAGAAAGFLLTVVWSAQFVDQTIGENTADTLLGHSAERTPISGIAAGVVFALVSGLAGTFTACNVAVFSSLTPLAGGSAGADSRVARALRSLAWLWAGALAVAVCYGVVVGFAGTRLPQFRTGSPGGGLSPLLVQSMIVFGVVGAILLWNGLAGLGLLPDPLARVTARFPHAPQVLMGTLVGAFLIGRPYPLFRHMFHDAAERHDPLYAAAAFGLQTFGNLLVVSILFLLIAAVAGPRLAAASPERAAALAAGAAIAAGVFLILYWDVRLLAGRGILPWYPKAPWA